MDKEFIGQINLSFDEDNESFYERMEELIDQKVYVYRELYNRLDRDPRTREFLKKHPYFKCFRKCKYDRCGKEFIVTKRNAKQLYCCEKHRKASFVGSERAKTKVGKCLYCGKEFLQYNFRNNKFCCVGCSNRYRNMIKSKKEQD